MSKKKGLKLATLKSKHLMGLPSNFHTFDGIT
jgi:hypothetical protein